MQSMPQAERVPAPSSPTRDGATGLRVTANPFHDSPRMVAQRARIAAAFGPAAQRPGDAGGETPLQARSAEDAGGLPGPLRAGIEALSGLDMSGVRVHRDSDKPAQLNALAYAQGRDIHLGPGQEQHLPHEAWHVVQQMQGRVAPSFQMRQGPTLGVGVNDDAGLEHEADLMGARALQMRAEPHAAPGAARSLMQRAVQAAVAQRSVGFELETNSAGWTVTRNGGTTGGVIGAVVGGTLGGALGGLVGGAVLGAAGALGGAALERWMVKAGKVDKGTALVHRPHFQLQAEYASDTESSLEFVTNAPGLLNRADYEQGRDGMVQLGQELNTQTGQSGVSAAAFAGGDPSYTLHPGPSPLSVSMQVTAGIPLAGLPKLMRNIGGSGVEKSEEYTNAAVQGTKASSVFNDKVGDSVQNKAALAGLMSLIRLYIIEGTVSKYGGGVVPFPKGITKIMARTDMHAAFAMLDQRDRQLVVNQMSEWIDALVLLDGAQSREGNAPDPRAEPLLGQVFDDPRSHVPAMKILTSRQRWLSQLPERDLLSMPRGADALDQQNREVEVQETKSDPDKPLPARSTYKAGSRAATLAELQELYLGLGSLHAAHDQVRYVGDDDVTKAVIVEIRKPSAPNEVASWAGAMDQYYDLIDDVIRRPEDGESRDFTNEPSADQRARGHAERIKASAGRLAARTREDILRSVRSAG